MSKVELSQPHDEVTWAAHELENATWTFAKTYAKTCPHWWTHRKQWDKETYFRVLRAILKHGVKRRWRNGPQRSYLRAGNGYEYWCMIEHGNFTHQDSFILNRAELPDEDHPR